MRAVCAPELKPPELKPPELFDAEGWIDGAEDGLLLDDDVEVEAVVEKRGDGGGDDVKAGLVSPRGAPSDVVGKLEVLEVDVTSGDVDGKIIETEAGVVEAGWGALAPEAPVAPLTETKGIDSFCLSAPYQ